MHNQSVKPTRYSFASTHGLPPALIGLFDIYVMETIKAVMLNDKNVRLKREKLPSSIKANKAHEMQHDKKARRTGQRWGLNKFLFM